MKILLTIILAGISLQYTLAVVPSDPSIQDLLTDQEFQKYLKRPNYKLKGHIELSLRLIFKNKYEIIIEIINKINCCKLIFSNLSLIHSTFGPMAIKNKIGTSLFKNWQYVFSHFY